MNKLYREVLMDELGYTHSGDQVIPKFPIRTVGHSTYAEQCKTMEWYTLKDRLMHKANYMCTQCGNPNERLEIDHIAYVPGRKAWQYTDDYFQVLCSPCHRRVTAERKKAKESNG